MRKSVFFLAALGIVAALWLHGSKMLPASIGGHAFWPPHASELVSDGQADTFEVNEDEGVCRCMFNGHVFDCRGNICYTEDIPLPAPKKEGR
jgi:hypothetical protein